MKLSQDNLSYNNKCPRCKKNRLVIKDIGTAVIGNCKYCGYQFKNEKQPTQQQQEEEYQPQQSNEKPSIFQLIMKGIHSINPFASIIALFAIVLSLIILAQVIGVDSNLDSYKVAVNKELTKNSNDIDEVRNNTAGNLQQLNNLKTKVSDIETGMSNYVNVNSLTNKLNALRTDLTANITSIEENITRIDGQLDTLSSSDESFIRQSTDINMTLFYLVNQSTAGDKRHCFFNITFENQEIDLQEVVYSIYMNGTNITLYDYESFIQPENFSVLNGTDFDNYRCYWFERTDFIMVSFLIDWNISKYNTTDLPKDYIHSNIKVNSVFLENPEIWTEDVE